MTSRRKDTQLRACISTIEGMLITDPSTETVLTRCLSQLMDLLGSSYDTAQDFIDRIKPKSIPAIILSGYSEAGLDANLSDNDVFDFLNKDEISSQLLSRSIDYVLERKEVLGVIENFSS